MERAWLAADRLCPPFVNQHVLEGRGALDLSAVRAAVVASSAVQPGVRLRLRGTLSAARWVVSELPPPVAVLDSDWDGFSDRGAPFLGRRLDPWRGPIAEVLLVRGGSSQRVVIRTHHAALDGRGAGLFSADVFRVLRGEAPLGASAGPLTDAALASELTERESPSVPARWRAPTGRSEGLAASVRWCRRRVVVPAGRLLPRALQALWRASQAHGEGPLRVGVPVDLRRHRPGLRSSSNLTGIAHVVLDGSDPSPALRAALADGDAAAHVCAARSLRGVPLWLMAWVGGRHARAGLRSGRFSTSATVSNLGRQDLAAHSGGGFVAQASYWIPPGQPGLPLFMTLSGDPGGVDVVASMPIGLASSGRLERLLDGVVADLAAGPI